MGSEKRASCRTGLRHLSVAVKEVRWYVQRNAGKDNVGRVGLTAAGAVGEIRVWGRELL